MRHKITHTRPDPLMRKYRLNAISIRINKWIPKNIESQSITLNNSKKLRIKMNFLLSSDKQMDVITIATCPFKKVILLKEVHMPLWHFVTTDAAGDTSPTYRARRSLKCHVINFVILLLSYRWFSPTLYHTRN